MVSHYLGTFANVDNVLRKLKSGKRNGYLGLACDHIINACSELSVHISLLLFGLIARNVVSENFCANTITLHILKEKIPTGRCLQIIAL